MVPAVDMGLAISRLEGGQKWKLFVTDLVEAEQVIVRRGGRRREVLVS